jgi:hypothetical protein
LRKKSPIKKRSDFLNLLSLLNGYLRKVYKSLCFFVYIKMAEQRQDKTRPAKPEAKRVPMTLEYYGKNVRVVRVPAKHDPESAAHFYKRTRNRFFEARWQEMGAEDFWSGYSPVRRESIPPIVRAIFTADTREAVADLKRVVPELSDCTEQKYDGFIF